MTPKKVMCMLGVWALACIAWGGRPLAINDADPLDPQQFEFESGEIFAEKEVVSGAESIAQFNTGFRWNPVESLKLDLAGGSKITGDAPDFTATVGLTWAFGFERSEKH